MTTPEDKAAAPAAYDPLSDPSHDPWAQGRGPATEPTGGASDSTSRAFAVGSAPVEQGPQRFIHDVPPVWDGANPGEQLEPYIKLLKGWLATTKTLKTQRGMVILHYANGDLKVIINELEIEVLAAEDSGEQVLEHIQKNYFEYIDRKMPKAIEAALYSDKKSRKKGESMLQYVARKKTLFRELQKAGAPLPDEMKGYLLLRDATLSDRARDTMETWTAGAYDWDTIEKYLKKLERPVPGASSNHITGLAGIVTDGSPEPGTTQMHGEGSEDPPAE